MAKTKLKTYRVTGCYTQYFECEVQAKNEDEARDLALSGDEDYNLGDCDDWYIDDVEVDNG